MKTPVQPAQNYCPVRSRTGLKDIYLKKDTMLYRKQVSERPPGYLSVDDVARKYCRSRSWALIHVKELPAVAVRYEHFYDPNHVEAYMQQLAWEYYLDRLRSLAMQPEIVDA